MVFLLLLLYMKFVRVVVFKFIIVGSVSVFGLVNVGCILSIVVVFFLLVIIKGICILVIFFVLMLFSVCCVDSINVI